MKEKGFLFILQGQIEVVYPLSLKKVQRVCWREKNWVVTLIPEIIWISFTFHFCHNFYSIFFYLFLCCCCFFISPAPPPPFIITIIITTASLQDMVTKYQKRKNRMWGTCSPYAHTHAHIYLFYFHHWKWCILVFEHLDGFGLHLVSFSVLKRLEEVILQIEII